MSLALNIPVPVRRSKIFRADIHYMIIKHIQNINARQTSTGMAGIGTEDIF